MDKRDLQQITDEYKVLKGLNSDNIVKVYDLIKREADYLLIMEFIDGVTLDKYIHKEFFNLKEIDQYIDIKQLQQELQKNFKFSDTYVQNGNIIYQNIVKQQIKQYHPEIYQCKQCYSEEYKKNIPLIIKQLVTTLQYIHSMKIMHRDIKTENIMIQGSRVVFIDFGFVGKKEIQSTLVGTVGFQAPECSFTYKGNRQYDKKIDVWSLGQVMFELVSGYNKNILSHNLYLNTIQQNLGLSLPMTIFLRDINISQNYLELIQSCLIVDPAMRSSSNDLVEMLQEEETQKQIVKLKIVFLGKYNIGKSTLLRKISRQYIQQDISQTTREVKYVDKENKAYTIKCTFIDTCGIENVSGSTLPRNLFRADLCLLESFEALDFYEMMYQRFNGGQLIKNQIQVIANDWSDQDNKDEIVKYKDYNTLYVNDETSKIGLLNTILKNYFEENKIQKSQLEKSYIGTIPQKNQKSCCQ